mmetsp:Transcript_84954/g.263906  ORF Transcript_84954/g.263906 Transcript_84954/m.263906 type:complete len:731 (-) Transcript_84954:86-2278(-)
MIFGGVSESKLAEVEGRLDGKIKDLVDALAKVQSQVDALKESQVAKPTQESEEGEEDNDDKAGKEASPLADIVVALGHMGAADQDCAERVLHVPKTYTIAASTWDCTLFLMTGPVKAMDSVLSVFACFIAFSLQLFFCVLIEYSMVDDAMSEDVLADLLNWRLFLGHEARFYHALDGQSLVARLCDGTLTLSVSATQAAFHNDITGYLKESLRNVLGAHDGRLLCIFCVLLWSLSILQELYSVRDFCRSIWRVSSRRATLFKEADGDGIRLKHLNSGRAFLITVFAVIPRIFIAIFLGWTGSKFLVFTTTMQDLLLNALALEFILSIDDVLFAVIVPRHVKDMQEHVEPLQMEASDSDVFYRLGFDGSVFLTVSIVVGFVLTLDFVYIREFEAHMLTAEEYLCGGERDFIVARNLGSGVMYSASTSSADVEDQQKSYAKQVMLQLTTLKDPVNWQGQAPAGPMSVPTAIADVVEMDSLSREASAGRFACSDHFGKDFDEHYAQWEALRFLLDKDFYSCAELKSECAVTAAHFRQVRAICPSTCGCDSVDAGIFDFTGCSSKCLATRQTVSSEIALLRECRDRNQTYLSNLPAWRSFFYDYGQHLKTTDQLKMAMVLLGFNDTEVRSATATTLQDLAVTSGCNISNSLLYSALEPNPCKEDTYYGSIRHYCPGSCEVICPPPDRESESQGPPTLPPLGPPLGPPQGTTSPTPPAGSGPVNGSTPTGPPPPR